MSEIEKIMQSFFDPSIAEYLNKIPSGKQLRSRLICAIAKDNKQAFLLSAIVETIHLASLLHDDIIDDAATRRGAPSLFLSEGSKRAVMIGDIFYSTAFAKLTELGLEISKIISESVAKLSIGELKDFDLSKTFNTDRKKYEEMIYLKTAALIEASCEAAAILAGKPREDYREFGKKIGLAFQVIDDLLDLTQSEEILGKPALSDLGEGKVTLPLIFLYENGNEKDRELLLSIFKKPIDKERADILKNRLEIIGAVKESRAWANTLLADAKALIDGENELLAIADKLVSRIK